MHDENRSACRSGPARSGGFRGLTRGRGAATCTRQKTNRKSESPKRRHRDEYEPIDVGLADLKRTNKAAIFETRVLVVRVAAAARRLLQGTRTLSLVGWWVGWGG